LSSPNLLPVAILAGGLAMRLRPITETIPKTLVPVAGEPFLFHQLRYLKSQGVAHVVICTGYLGEQVEAAVGDGAAFGLRVEISPDGATLLGTGGALRRAAPRLGDAFFVLYGDSFLPCDFRAVEAAFRESGKPALMAVLRNEDRWDTSNVIFADGQLLGYSKRRRTADMHHIDYGLGVIAASLLRDKPADEAWDLADLYEELSQRGQLAGVEVTERFYEIGSHTGLAETERFLSERQRAAAHPN
jgi:MurNAc alpha-1-phosphate uridylyltransferase